MHVHEISNKVELLNELLQVNNGAKARAFLAQLPIAPSGCEYYDPLDPKREWRPGMLHWVPVGMQRNNAGRIQLANAGENPLAERVVNACEALIELARQRELTLNPDAPMPSSPREAVARYFNLPALDQITERSPEWKRAREIAKLTRVRVSRIRGQVKGTFTVQIQDEGIGQPPHRVHDTLLSLSNSSKGDKPYLIGVFGQGGSSSYHATQDHSWIISRRAPDVPGGEDQGAGWTFVKHVFPSNRRDAYYAYLAADPSGQVPSFAAEVADAVKLAHGTTFTHIDYDLKRSGVSVARNLYPAMNHLLFNPMLPYDLYNQKETADPCWGNAYRLSLRVQRLRAKGKGLDELADKSFGAQRI